jgi:glycerol kinase
VAWRFDSTPTYCVDGQVYTVSSAVRWLIDMGIVASAEELDVVAARVDNAGSVSFVPAFAGLAAPWWRSDVKASLSGLGLDSNAGHVVRALFEGIAAQVAAMVDAAGIAAGAPLTHLQVDGGLTQSRLLMQTQADLLQIPVEVYGSSDATAHGVAIAARMGIDGASVAVPARWQRSTVYEPIMHPDLAGAIRERHDRSVARMLGSDAS